MSPRQVFEAFKRIFPGYFSKDLVFFPNGKNSIRIRNLKEIYANGQDVIFSVESGTHCWRLESVDSYLENWKESKKK